MDCLKGPSLFITLMSKLEKEGTQKQQKLLYTHLESKVKENDENKDSFLGDNVFYLRKMLKLIYLNFSIWKLYR